ncbi:unnamed protein product [Pipistrellus nathusii]|uniref:Uncharacterized protein n=1 Tax=Pipistrellus nathusii TaxID=59473 RepID=A0ABP0A778_PIPNA
MLHLGQPRHKARVACRGRGIDGMTHRRHFMDKNPEPSWLSSVQEAWGKQRLHAQVCLALQSTTPEDVKTTSRPAPLLQASVQSGIPSALWKLGVTGGTGRVSGERK